MRRGPRRCFPKFIALALIGVETVMGAVRAAAVAIRVGSVSPRVDRFDLVIPAVPGSQDCSCSHVRDR